MQTPGRDATLPQWLAWLETLHPKKIDLSLNRIRTVLEVLGLEQPPFVCITVGGTNGKGSCVAYLSQIYRRAGLRTGAFTSPHLIDFNERIAVDGVPASDAELVAAFEEMNAARDEITLSYFEASAVAALICFARRRVEIAVLEVGMGGRLDAVNAIDADAALIVSVGLDHEEWLGNDRESIGFEKAGIMRSARPAVIADPQPPASVATTAQHIGADVLFIGKDFDVAEHGDALRIRCRSGATCDVPRPGFGGAEQWLNVAASVQIVECLAGRVPVPEAAVRQGIAAAAPAGRGDIRMLDDVEWVLDVAHNPAAAERLVAMLATRPAAARTWAVFGALTDKDIVGVLNQFAQFVDGWFCVDVHADRGALSSDVAKVLAQARSDADISGFADVAAACSAVRNRATAGDRIVVFGSFHVVGPALSVLELYCEPPG